MFENSIREDQYTNEFGTFYNSIFNVEWLDYIKPKTIVEVGAYDFGDAIRFKKHCPEADVYSFEMSPDNFKKHADTARKAGIKVYNRAVSNIGNIFTKFYESKHVGGVNAQGSLLRPNHNYNQNYGHIVSHTESDVYIETIRLDSFCQQENITSIDLLHIDVEGFEYQVIESLGVHRPRFIFAEFLIDGAWDGQRSFTDMHHLLYLMGYKQVGQYSFDRLYEWEK